jgi:signal transduction histidine kinase
MAKENTIDQSLDTFISIASGNYSRRKNLMLIEEDYGKEVPSYLAVGIQLLTDHLKSTTVSKKKLEIANIKLRKTSQQLNEAQRIAKTCSWEYELDKKLLSCSDEFYRIFEISKKEKGNILKIIKKKTHPDDLPTFEKQTVNLDSIQKKREFEFRIVNGEKTTKYLSTIFKPIHRNSSKTTIISGSCQDVTERKIIEIKQREIEKLQTIHEKAINDASNKARELEQKRISQELHDDIGSSLTVLKFNIQQLKIPQDKIENINSLLTNVLGKVRELSNGLLPSALNEFGFITAVETLAKNIHNSESITCLFESNNLILTTLNSEEELSLFRVVQEVLANITKYANASRIKIDLIANEEKISIMITDNGRGFIPSHKYFSKNTNGLINIHNRISQIGATIQYTKKFPKGTIVQIEKIIEHEEY